MGKSKTKNRPIGRASDYRPDIADAICKDLALGHSLNSICKRPDMPDLTTVYAWLRTHDDFSQNYTRAKEDQADTLADQIVAIADESSNDTIIDDKGNERPNSEWINRSRLRVDARKWVAAKLKPKKYGDKVQTEITGADGGPVKVESTATFDALLAKLEAAARVGAKG